MCCVVNKTCCTTEVFPIISPKIHCDNQCIAMKRQKKINSKTAYLYHELHSGELLWQTAPWQHWTQGHLGNWTTVYTLYLNASQPLLLLLSWRLIYSRRQAKPLLWTNRHIHIGLFMSNSCLVCTMGSHFDKTEFCWTWALTWSLIVELPTL